MENRHRLLLGIGVEVFRSSASETEGCLSLLDRAKRRLGFEPRTLGADKGFFSQRFIEAIFDRHIEPHGAHPTQAAAEQQQREMEAQGIIARTIRR